VCISGWSEFKASYTKHGVCDGAYEILLLGHLLGSFPAKSSSLRRGQKTPEGISEDGLS
jgi:hypothetical protein